MWRRWKLLDMSIQQFYQEFPSTPMESFISSGLSVFDQSKIIERLRYISTPKIYSEIKLHIPDTLRRFLGKSLMIYQLPNMGKNTTVVLILRQV